MRPVLVLLALVRIATASDPTLAAYFPLDTKVVIGARMRALADAGIFQESKAFLASNPIPGFDPLKDLDEVLIATNGEGENPPAIVVLRGRFNLELLAKNATRYRDVAILEVAKQPGTGLALIDETTALAGDLRQIRAAIDRRGQSGPDVARMDALRERYGIWGYGSDLQSVERFEFGAAFEKGLQFTAEIRVRNDKDAEQIASTLRMVESMMKNAKKSPGPQKKSPFDMSIDQGTVKLSLSLSEAELKKTIREQSGPMTMALASGMQTRARAASATLVPRVAPAVVASAPSAPAGPPKPPVLNSNGDTVILTLPGGH